MENKFDLIEKYLMSEMSVKEQVEFEELLRSDPELMKEYIFQKEIYEAIGEDDIISLRNNLHEIVNQDTSYTRKIKRSVVYYAFAAVIALTIAVSGICFLQVKHLNKNEIFQSYYSPYPVIISYRAAVSQTETEKNIINAFNSYDQGNFKIASDYFKEVLANNNMDYMSEFYIAICEIEENNFSQAEEYLKDLILKKDHIFWEQSHWYLALAYIKQNKMRNAENILNKIIQEEMTQKQDAEDILKILN